MCWWRPQVACWPTMSVAASTSATQQHCCMIAVPGLHSYACCMVQLHHHDSRNLLAVNHSKQDRQCFVLSVL
jgi:hypothetical protein